MTVYIDQIIFDACLSSAVLYIYIYFIIAFFFYLLIKHALLMAMEGEALKRKPYLFSECFPHPPSDGLMCLDLVSEQHIFTGLWKVYS